MKNRNNSGFTLVELAIVLVVIALLVAIVAAGKNIIAAGQVRAVVKEAEEIQSSMVRFQEKYSSLPGDMPDAEAQFGCGATCNGDGNERIRWNIAIPDGTFHEGPLAFYHLQRAQMLGGDPLTGTDGLAKIGENIPASKIANAGWAVVDLEDYAVLVPIFPRVNALFLGGRDETYKLNVSPVIEPKNAFTIDDKLDDGAANTGRIRGYSLVAPLGCEASGAYAVADNRKLCVMSIQLDTSL